MKKSNELILPALRGIMGDWVYYSCLMSIEEIGKRVSYADEIHKNEKLSELIQRQLKKGRSEQISSYLQNQDERFFNSLVVATALPSYLRTNVGGNLTGNHLCISSV